MRAWRSVGLGLASEATAPLLASVFAMGLASGLAGCSSSGDPAPASAADAGCQAYVVPAGTDLAAPVVSLSTDIVLPIFSKTCAFSSCHGGTNNNHGIYLAGDAPSIRKALVNVAATNAPGLSLVVPGNPGASFLMHKIDGDQCTLLAKCTGGDCGTSMPQASASLGAPLLEVGQRDTLRRWIAQGAPDN